MLSTGEYHADSNAIVVDARLMEPVGERHHGGFGAVQIYASRSNPDQTVAAKFPIPSRDRPVIDEACAELRNSLYAPELRHPNIVTLLGAIRTDNELVLLMQDCSKGTLETFGQRLDAAEASGKINADTAATIRLTLAHDLLAGLAHLHDEVNVTHGDFKPQNIFLGVDGYAKVGDFDRASPGPSCQIPMKKQPAAHQYLAPEVIREEADGIPVRRHRHSSRPDVSGTGHSQTCILSDGTGQAIPQPCCRRVKPIDILVA